LEAHHCPALRPASRRGVGLVLDIGWPALATDDDRKR
jgi:hypothetical protein